MKTRKKITKYILSALTLVMALGAVNAFAAPGDYVWPLIHKGAGAQIATEMLLGASADTSALLNINESGTNSVFDGVNGTSLDDQGFITVLGNSWLQDKIFVGKNRDLGFQFSPLFGYSEITAGTQSASDLTVWTSDFNPGPSTMTATLQKMNIFGGILSTNMNTAAGNVSGSAQVCVDSVGTLVMC